MSEHAERFTGRVEDYERYRTRYPAAVIDVLVERCGLQREHHVADIGAGTGMLAELFLEHGNAVVAVEPNDDMRAACERLASAWPGLTVKKGTAEATGLEVFRGAAESSTVGNFAVQMAVLEGSRDAVTGAYAEQVSRWAGLFVVALEPLAAKQTGA